MAPGVQARHAHRVLDRLGAAVGEEDLGGAFEGAVEDELGGAVARLVAVLGGDRAQRRRLLLDRRAPPSGCWWPMLVFTSWDEKSR